MRQILLTLGIFLATGLFPKAYSIAPDPFLEYEEVDPDEHNGFWGFGIGGDFMLYEDSKSFDRLDPRFALVTEVGNRYFSAPIVFTMGQGIRKAHFYPRWHYYFQPFKDEMPTLFFAPGVGPAFQVQYEKTASDTTFWAINLGFQTGAMLMWKVSSNGYIALSSNFEYSFLSFGWLGGNYRDEADNLITTNLYFTAGVNF